MKPFETTAIKCDGERLWALDQTRLPETEVWFEITDPMATIEAISQLRVRGAPLIGVAAALCLGLYHEKDGQHFEAIAGQIRAARPTAVNLAASVNRLLRVFEQNGGVTAEAETILTEDQRLCDLIAREGAELVTDGMGILTHCNAGALATAGVGTALGVICRAAAQGKAVHVFVDETRPLLQGARLTTWELRRAKVPYTLITDSMAASLMRLGKIQMAIVGADRIAANGDVANKIGTYSLAVNCRYHQVPLVVAAPYTTVDWHCETGRDIPIEMREEKEIRDQEPCWNPAFDVTPGQLVSSFVLDTGAYSLAQFCELRR